jgi:hypothetical protein
MMGFRDMTFCPFNADCKKSSTCPRALTPAIHDAAAKWWGKPGAPISVYTTIPTCHEPQGEPA